ncbi:P2X purinoceptor 7-like [Anneissia japonica]|uniref:P2X purinoceptor 7-like n=1 Tax=Anneissia japonica TaxID=1529436 RepID=UPI001425594D|nr:P2X purinoceptor 7-like [Anneissia japonica]
MADHRRPMGFLFEPEKHKDSVEIEEAHEYDQEVDEAMENRLDNLNWCACGQCQLMPTNGECLCCREEDIFTSKMDENSTCCISKTETFKNACKNKDILEIIMAALKEVVGEDLRDPISNRLYRYAAYRSFTWWVYGKLGRKRRKVIPTCAVHAIRHQFPEADQNYEGYHDAIKNISLNEDTF